MVGIKKLVGNLPGIRGIDRYLRYRYTGNYNPEPYERGHYSSPLPDISEVQSRASILFRKEIDLEYPLQWIQAGKAWNEAYLLRAFLQYNSHFEILLLNCFVGRVFRAFMQANMPRFLKDPGGSLWLRKSSQ